MHEGMRGENYNFAEIVAAARERCEKAFQGGAAEAVPVEGEEVAHWNFDDEFALLEEEMRSVADQCRKDETKKMVNIIEVRLCSPILHGAAADRAPAEELQEADLGAGRPVPEQAHVRYMGQGAGCFP